MIVIEQPGGEHYTIRPCDIALEPVSGAVEARAFGFNFIDKAAGYLIRFFQDRGAWILFDENELKEFLAANNLPSDCPLYGLHGTWQGDEEEDDDSDPWYDSAEKYVARTAEGAYAVTDLFIERCKGTA